MQPAALVSEMLAFSMLNSKRLGEKCFFPHSDGEGEAIVEERPFYPWKGLSLWGLLGFGLCGILEPV